MIITSWLIPAGRSWWDAFDPQAFYFLNGWVAENRAAQIFWAVCSSRVFDALMGILLLGMFYLYIREDRSQALTRFCEGAFMFLWLIFTVKIIKSFDMPRFSPSHSLQPLHDLTLMVPWAHAKVLGKNTFPSDHTVVLWTAATFIVYYTGRRFGPIAVVLATIACMPGW